MPQVGQLITVNLPDERTRAEVVQVISETGCLAKIAQFTTAAKSHSYRKGDIVAVQMRKDGMGQQGWTAIEERPTAPRPETIASLADAAEDEAEDTEDALGCGNIQEPPQPQPEQAPSKKGGKHSKRNAA